MSPKIVKLLRIGIVVMVTISFYFVFRAMLIELAVPGTGENSIYGTLAYSSMLIVVLLGIPLWALKIKRIQAYFKTLDSLYGSDDLAREDAIKSTIKSMFVKNIPQIAYAFVFSVIIYYICITYILTPEITTGYIESIKSLNAVPNSTDTYYIDNVTSMKDLIK